MKKFERSIKKIIWELELLLDSEEQQEPEEPKPLLTGPCIAKTRSGDVVPVQRNFGRKYKFSYLPDDSSEETVLECGTYFLDNTDRDIVEVIRPLTEQEVLDWQFRGIEPELSVASEPVAVVAEVFKSSELGRKEAEQMGLVYLGKATSYGMHEVDGTLYFFDYWNNEWKPKPGDYRVCEDDIYAFKPAT